MGLIKLGETSGHTEKEENILAKDSTLASYGKRKDHQVFKEDTETFTSEDKFL